MPITPPGRRLVHNCKLSFVSTRGASRRRGAQSGLSLTALLDVLLAAVVFLLTTFDTSGSCTAYVHVPAARNVLDMIDAPTITVARGDILLNGSRVGTDHEVEGATAPVRLQGLADALRQQRRLWQQFRPGVAPPESVVLRMDGDTRALVVKSVFATAGRAGYPNVSLMVARLDD
jgi:biopolymer transport protein ExbD